MKHHIVATALMFGSALAHAQSAHWTFTYTGFYDQEAAVFLPDMQIAGSFTGTDANADGVLDLGELNSLTIGSMDYIACASGSNAYYHCGADRFTFSPNQGLSFSLGEYGSDPEGWRGGGHFVESGKMRYDYDFDPRTSTEHHLLWTDATSLTMLSASPVSPVPEAPAWAMLAAGLGAVALWRRRPGKPGSPTFSVSTAFRPTKQAFCRMPSP
jgi:MYXO-CTERM domain-containing protein